MRTRPTKYNFSGSAGGSESHFFVKKLCFPGMPNTHKHSQPEMQQEGNLPKKTKKTTAFFVAPPTVQLLLRGNSRSPRQDVIRRVTFSNFVDVHEINSWRLQP